LEFIAKFLQYSHKGIHGKNGKDTVPLSLLFIRVPVLPIWPAIQ